MQSEILIYGVDECEDTQMSRAHLSQRGIPYTYINLDHDPEAERQVKEWNGGKKLTPTIVVSGSRGSQRVAEPADDDLDVVLVECGIDQVA